MGNQDLSGLAVAPGELVSLDIFRGLPADELAGIAGDFSAREVRAAETIITRGDGDLNVNFLLEGNARVVQETPLGRWVELSTLAAGCYFGELSAIDGVPRSAEAQAVSDCRLASVSPDGFQRLLIAHPSILVNVLQNLTKIIRRTNATVLGLATL
jgi:CRP/FNR family cyclic AMP-dependent transcriptional regulator